MKPSSPDNGTAAAAEEPKNSQITKKRLSRKPGGAERVFFLLGTIVLAYLFGAFSGAYNVWPYPSISKGFEALQAFVHKASLDRLVDKYDSSTWRPAQFAASGVVVHDADRAQDGYTLITSGHQQGALLLEMDGTVVHEWKRPFRSVWDDPPHVPQPIPPGFIHWSRTHLYPNGDLVAVIMATEDTPQGYGLLKVDRESELLWAYSDTAHHDFHVDSDGSIWAMVTEIRDLAANPLPGAAPQEIVLLDEFVVRLSVDGEELSRMSLLDALASSPFKEALRWQEQGFWGEMWDPLHPNSVKPAGAFARHHPAIEPTDLILSLRNLHMIAAVDPNHQTIDWVGRGLWRRQHDADPLPDGSLLIFDNLGSLGSEGSSQIVRFSLADGATSIVYAGTEDAAFHSEIRGTQQMLAGGNLLITDSENGRVIEVSADGEIVWEYRNPQRVTVEGRELVAILQGATRIPRDFPKFL